MKTRSSTISWKREFAIKSLIFWIRIKLMCKEHYEHERDFHHFAESVFGLQWPSRYWWVSNLYFLLFCFYSLSFYICLLSAESVPHFLLASATVLCAVGEQVSCPNADSLQTDRLYCGWRYEQVKCWTNRENEQVCCLMRRRTRPWHKGT